MSALGPTLETDRLILRPPIADDWSPWCAMMADAETAHFIGGVIAPSAVWLELCTIAGSWALSGVCVFSVIEKSSGRWIGRIGPWAPPGWPGTEVAWGLTRDAWGKGYATEGAAATVRWAFEHLGWTNVIHCIDPANAASIRLAERLGARHLRPGTLPPPYDAYTVEIWGQSREQWRTFVGA